MTDATWDDYVSDEVVDSTDLADLSYDIGDQAEVLETAVADGDVGSADVDAVDDAAGDLRDAQWDTSTASEWSAGAERDAGYADTLDAEGDQHLQGAAEALAQGDLASAEWESSMAESSFDLAEDADDQAAGGFQEAGESLSSAAGEVDLAADTLEDSGWGAELDTSVDSGLDTSLDTGLDTSFDTGLDSGFDAGLDTSLDTGMDLGSDDI